MTEKPLLHVSDRYVLVTLTPPEFVRLRYALRTRAVLNFLSWSAVTLLGRSDDRQRQTVAAQHHIIRAECNRSLGGHTLSCLLA